jgi:hypothetical protein
LTQERIDLFIVLAVGDVVAGCDIVSKQHAAQVPSHEALAIV